MYSKLHYYRSFRKSITICFAVLGCSVYYIFTFVDRSPAVIENLDTGVHLGHYLINTSTCKIPDLGPYNEGIMRFLSREKFEPCSKIELLTYIEKDIEGTYLKLNASLLQFYSPGISCCYSNITRSAEGSDDSITYSRCHNFKTPVRLYHPAVKVVCTNVLRIIEYNNIHFATIPQQHQNIRRDPIEENIQKFSVVFIGIDSISRWHLERTMPKSFKFLNLNFQSLYGYNKIGENTFPNLMAILNGHDTETLRTTCDDRGNIGGCYFIWNDFKDAGYITGFAENDALLSTFNYNSMGFRTSPTDYYYRPYSIAAEYLPTTIRYHRMVQCTGPENYGVRWLNAAKDFIVSFSDKPIFGFFWMNSFSHDNYNFPSTMDDKVLEFLTDNVLWKSINNTFIVFLSDHGYRFGVIRDSYRGWLEERLPYVFVHVPEKFKIAHPGKFKAFSRNTRKLTTPYDIFSTLQDILSLGNASYVPKQSVSCSNCKSLFTDIEENRTCHMAGIPEYYCTCRDYEYADADDPLIAELANVMIAEVNNLVNSYKEKDLCLKYSVGKVTSASVRNNLDKKNYLLKVETLPYSLFEGLVEVGMKNGVNKYAVLGDITRLNRYSCYSRCVSDKILKKHCYCAGIISKFFIYLGSVMKLC